MTRRNFIGTSALFTAASYNKVVGANNRINLGFIGVGHKYSRGTGLMEKCCLNHPLVEPIAVCDVHDEHLARAASIVRSRGKSAVPYKDFRDLLERKDIDAVVIATPDHWHALMTIEACRAGKDVYLEKPISHSISEEEFMLEAARQYNRIVQVGTQQRSNRSFQDAVKIVQSGILGKINHVETWIYWVPDLEIQPANPRGLNWDMWLGPAPYHDYEPGRFRFSWRYFWDYAGGKTTDWGAHHFDIVLWATKQKGPIKAMAGGGKWYVKDNRDTPDSLWVIYEFPDFICTFEHAPGQYQGDRRENHGIKFTGERGVLTVTRKWYETKPNKGQRLDRSFVDGRWLPLRGGQDRQDSQKHMNNFIDCVVTRRPPVSSLFDHRATQMAHLGNIAYRSGQTVFVDQNTGTISPAWLHRYLGREYRAPWKLEI